MPGWVTTTGNTDCYIQEASWNCALACIAMVLNRMGHGHPTTRAIADTSRRLGGDCYIPANVDRAGFQDHSHNSTALLLTSR
jgi:hypothetical protein